MELIDKDKYKRDTKYIKSLFEVKNGKTFTKGELKIIFPQRFISKSLAVMGSTVTVIGLFGILSNGKFANTIAPIMFKTTPMGISESVIDGKEYVVLEFDKDQVFMDNNNLIQQESFMYNIFEEFYLAGNIPWYMDYEDLSNVFLESKKYAKSRIGDNPVTLELLTSVITRDTKDKMTLYRNAIKDKKDKRPYEYIGLSNIFYSYNNTGARLVGSYLKLGINAALVDKEKEPTKVASLLRV
jgi:hypothetical protein